jgi:hypothetical protein
MGTLLLLLAIGPAKAQFADPSPTAKPAAEEPAPERRAPALREIEKGTYLKANVGVAAYVGDFAGAVDPGTSMALAIGHDFVDLEKQSMSFEAAFAQGIHNGCPYETQVDGSCLGGPPGPYVQGDIRTYSGIATLEYSTYPTRRLGLGVRAGGGMMWSPLLIDEGFWQDQVLPAWGVDPPPYHEGTHILVLGGPTLEYYTKLNHFSIGIDADITYATDFDVGVNVTAALKYTF